MSRSGIDEADYWEPEMALYRGRVANASKGKRGQRFWRALLEALDAMPAKKLHDTVLVTESGCCCAMGAMLKHQCKAEGYVQPDPDRSVPYWEEDYTDDPEWAISGMAEDLDVSAMLIREVVWANDEWGGDRFIMRQWNFTEEEARWWTVRHWVARQILSSSQEVLA